MKIIQKHKPIQESARMLYKVDQRIVFAYPQNSSITAKSYNEVNLLVQHLFVVVYQEFSNQLERKGGCYVNRLSNKIQQTNRTQKINTITNKIKKIGQYNPTMKGGFFLNLQQELSYQWLQLAAILQPMCTFQTFR